MKVTKFDDLTYYLIGTHGEHVGSVRLAHVNFRPEMEAFLFGLEDCRNQDRNKGNDGNESLSVGSDTVPGTHS